MDYFMKTSPLIGQRSTHDFFLKWPLENVLLSKPFWYLLLDALCIHSANFWPLFLVKRAPSFLPFQARKSEFNSWLWLDRLPAKSNVCVAVFWEGNGLDGFKFPDDLKAFEWFECFGGSTCKVASRVRRVGSWKDKLWQDLQATCYLSSQTMVRNEWSFLFEFLFWGEVYWRPCRWKHCRRRMRSSLVQTLVFTLIFSTFLN